MANNEDHHIVATYGAEYQGLINYYLLAGYVSRSYTTAPGSRMYSPPVRSI